jgi:hypothetical protein
MGAQLEHDLGNSVLARKVLRNLELHWPLARDLTPAVLGDLDFEDMSRAFLGVMRMLCDNGYVMYEAVLVREGVTLYHDAAITPRGRAALNAATPG